MQPEKLERGMVLVAPSGKLVGEKLRFQRHVETGAMFERIDGGGPAIVGVPWPWPGWVLAESFPGLTVVQSLRARGEPEERDVVITRPGPWGNQFSVARSDIRRSGSKNALDLYREWLDEQIRKANTFTGGRKIQTWIRRLKDLAGKRLLCACERSAIRHGACHGVPLAQAIEKLTGIGYELAPGTAEED